MWCSLALDESTDVQDTIQLLIFIQGVDTKFQLMEKLLSVELLKDITSGQERCVEIAGLAWNKLVSVTTDALKLMS